MKIKKNAGKIIAGAIIVFIGVAFLGKLLGFWETEKLFLGWWAALIVAVSLISIISDRANIVNIYFLIFGIGAFLCEREIIKTDVSMWLLALYLLLIVIGVRLLLSALFGKKNRVTVSSTRHDDKTNKDLNAGAVSFGEQTLDFSGLEYSGGDYDVSFGELTLDLRGAILGENVKINVKCSFGEVKIIVPEGASVTVHEKTTLGSVSKENIRETADGAKIDISCAVSFGSIEISEGGEKE